MVISPGSPGLGQAGLVDRPDGFCLSCRAEVVGVGVGVTQDGESCILEVSQVLRRVTERVTLPNGGRRALASRRRGEGAFEIAEDDRAPWVRYGLAAARYRSGCGGSSGVFPSIVSPTAAMVTGASGVLAAVLLDAARADMGWVETVFVGPTVDGVEQSTPPDSAP
jgi:hypothetical protein